MAEDLDEFYRGPVTNPLFVASTDSVAAFGEKMTDTEVVEAACTGQKTGLAAMSNRGLFASEVLRLAKIEAKATLDRLRRQLGSAAF